MGSICVLVASLGVIGRKSRLKIDPPSKGKARVFGFVFVSLFFCFFFFFSFFLGCFFFNASLTPSQSTSLISVLLLESTKMTVGLSVG